jgi:hypothetical protein
VSPLVISTGGMLVGAGLLTAVIVPWWRKPGASAGGFGKTKAGGEPSGGRSIKALIAPVLVLALGLVLGEQVGGFLGGSARRGSTGANQLGNDGLQQLTGAPPTTVTHPPASQVGAGAAIVILLGLLVLVLVWRKASRQRRRDFGLCLLAGISLAPSAVALTFTGAVTDPTLNWLGEQIVGRWM